MKLPTVAILGRPNVGKSTLFNKIVGKRVSIIEDIPGVTRDRIYEKTSYKNKSFYLIDTGGIDDTNLDFNKEIKLQATLAIEEADVIIFIVDGKDGLTSNDLVVKNLLRKYNKKVIVAINKIDVKESQNNLYDFYELGFDYYIPISSIHNKGYIELMDEVTKDFQEKEEKEDTRTKISVIGRPNVGKSSLVNALLNEERMVVSNIAGTTRDSVDTEFKYNGKEYVLIDTAGMRKQGKIYENVEKYSLFRSMKAIERSDICLIVLNAEEGIKEHDKHIAGYALEAGKGVILVVNKWDKSEDTITNYKELIRNEFQFMTYAKVVFLSALTKKRISTLMPEVERVEEAITKEIPTNLLNDVIIEAQALNQAPSYKGKRLRIYFTNQTGIKPPKFTLRVNNKGLVHFSYERYIENTIRKNFNFEGTPIIIKWKNRGNE